MKTLHILAAFAALGVAVAVADSFTPYQSNLQRTVERMPQLGQPCPNGVAVGYNTDAGASGWTVRSDAGYDTADAAQVTATCLELRKDQDYRIVATVPVCTSNGTGRLGNATNCNDLPKFADSAPESIRFPASPDGGQPCVHVFAQSGTAGAVQFCPLSPNQTSAQTP
jgi:hypothetical protein